METRNRYYTPYTYKKVEENYFSSDAPDYKQVQNLLAGKGQAILAYGSMKDVDMTPQFNTPDTESRLTDGVLAQKATYSDPAWVRFTRGVARSILFDIGAIAALQEVRIRLLKEKETAVRLPNNVSFSASVNGVDFENVALIDRFHSESGRRHCRRFRENRAGCQGHAFCA